MSFCTKCGTELSDDAIFCSKCGTPTKQAGTGEKRKMVYDGAIHKCPNCGEVIESFVGRCPSCDFEIRDVEISEYLQKFTKELRCAKSDRAKISIIESLAIPNTKEDLLEILIFSSSNVDNYDNINLCNAFEAKMEQAYLKLKILNLDSKELSQIEKIYQEGLLKKNKKDKFNNRENFIKKYGMYFIVAFSVLILLTFAIVTNIITNDADDTDTNSITIGVSDDNLKGKNYEDVITILEQKGFYNIETRKTEDLITGWITKENSVESVSINGETEFMSTDKFPKDAKIIITYHAFSENE